MTARVFGIASMIGFSLAVSSLRRAASGYANELRDFDQTVIIRPSTWSGSRCRSLPPPRFPITIGDMLESIIHCYERAFQPNFDQKHDLDQPRTSVGSTRDLKCDLGDIGRGGHREQKKFCLLGRHIEASVETRAPRDRCIVCE